MSVLFRLRVRVGGWQTRLGKNVIAGFTEDLHGCFQREELPQFMQKRQALDIDENLPRSTNTRTFLPANRLEDGSVWS